MPFKIIRNDITKVRADAIVNTANPEPVYAGGTDAAVYRAAGEKKLLKERAKIGRIAPGEAAVTPAFGLHAKYIIHTVGPVWEGGAYGEYDLLASCYRKSLLLARHLGCRSIAFPLISTGVYGFPKDRALDIALEEISSFLNKEENNSAPGNEMDVTLVVFDRKTYELSSSLTKDVEQFIDDHYAAFRWEEEYEADFYRERAASSRGRRNALSAGKNDFHFEESESSFSEDGMRELPEFSGGKYADDMKGLPSFLQERSEDNKRGLPSFLQERSEDNKKGLPSLSQERSEDNKRGLSSFSRGRSAKKRQETVEEAAAAYHTVEGRSLQDVVAQVGETFQESLLRMIDERGLTDVQVYKRANMDRRLFSKIRSNPKYNPKRETAVAFALALRLNMDETRDLLGRAGLALSPASRFDLIISYCVQNRIYDIVRVNAILFDYNQPLLGA